MIKIIISGTSDGFYPRYASDGILDDEISQLLLDRRRFFSRDADRLYKEGYSFQQVAGEQAKGILYHKIILLYDGFGRDGFMMASIFLPQGEKLDGSTIKEALDALIRDYKAYTVNGIANVEVDWSFVNKQAEELKGKVLEQTWRNQPQKNNSSVTALIKGVNDNRVADYFQYPNPMNSGCQDFGQVFLTESMLDPAMASEDGTQGYKVLTTTDVDIDNPEYTLEYENEQPGAILSDKRYAIKKNELVNNTNGISLGTYSMSGYRSVPVQIPAGTTSLDGETITVKLPTLKQKEASVEFNVVDDNTGQSIVLNEADIRWTEEGSFSLKNMGLKKNKVSFTGSECDKTWTFIINCDGYDEFKNEIYVADNKKETPIIRLKPEPLWTVVVKLPGGREKSLYKDVPSSDLGYQTKAAIGYLKERDLDVEDSKEDRQNFKVTIVGKKRELSAFGKGESDGYHDGGFGGSNYRDSVIPAERNKYYLILDNDSRDYSLFRNYRNKKKLEKEYSQAIAYLKGEATGNFKNPVEDIINDIENNNLPQAKKAIDKLFDSQKDNTNPRVERIVKVAQTAVKTVKKMKRIPEVVKTDGMEYDWQKHQIEKKSDKFPNRFTAVVLNSDQYDYSIPNPKWTNDGGRDRSEVKRKLRTQYKVLYASIALVALVLAGLQVAWYINPDWFPPKDQSNDGLTSLAKEIYDCNDKMNKSGKRYCGDIVYYRADSLHKVYSNLSNESRDSLKPIFVKNYSTFAYNSFENSFNDQTERKLLDSTVYQEGLKLLNISPKLPSDFNRLSAKKKINAITQLSIDFDNWKKMWGVAMRQIDCLSQPHFDTLDAKYNQTVQTLTAIINPEPVQEQTVTVQEEDDAKAKARAIAAEQALYQKCTDPQKATVKDCESYLRQYRKTAPADQVQAVEHSLNKLKEKQAQEAAEAKEKAPTKKSPIASYDDLWNALKWDDFQAKGMNSFLEKYEFKGENSVALKQLANDIINAATKGNGNIEAKKAKFIKARNDASAKRTSKKKLEELKELLQ